MDNFEFESFRKRKMESKITREAAVELLKKYNKDPFHLQHALTVEGVMRWYARELGFADEEEFWGWWDCCTISILSSIPNSIASRRRNCCGKEA